MRKNILITGGAGFLGSIFAEYLIKKHNVFVVDINFQKLKNLKSSLNKIEIFKCDISVEKNINSLSAKLDKKKVFIDVLINNANIDSIPKNNKKTKSLIDLKSWKKEINVGLTGALMMTSVFGNKMVKKRAGKIINLGSDLSIIAPNQNIYKNVFKNFIKPASYSVIKHGLFGMTKYYASLFAEHNVSVNMLSPGPIFNNHKKDFEDELKKIIPCGRMGKPPELLPALDFLIDTKNSFMTGANLVIDGGRTVI